MRVLLRAALVVALFVGVLGSPGARGATNEKTYITMSDGVQIAVSINYPEGFSADRDWPALFQMDGYAAGGSGGVSTAAFGEKYVTIYASIRGTGCSGGRFDLFDRRHAQDGWEIIEGWIVNQSWSDGDVGIVGHSYPGLTGFLVASTNPPHLKATAISGLIDDLYRGIVYPGGVPNYGFPAIWTGAYRPAIELAGNAGRMADETAAADPTCAANIATRPPREPLDDPMIQGLSSQQDETWWAVRSLYSYIHGITKPIHMTQQYQDEQTGPRGGHVLFQRVSESVPKRLVVTNGVHGTTALARQDRARWLDCWIINDGQNCGAISDPSQRVQLYFDTQNTDIRPAEYVTSDWPAPETSWTRYFLRADGTLGTSPGADGQVSYLNLPAGREMTADAGFGLGDESIGRVTFTPGPDEASFRLAFSEPTAIAGPGTLTLWASSTAPDTDFFVDVLEEDTATGAITYLQRGMLRASHRAVDGLRSDRVASGPEAGAIYRPHHPHTSPVPILPLENYEFTVELFPFGHVFRPGHDLVMRVHAPPPADPLSIYAWVSAQPPSVNTILQVDGMRSSVLLPVLPALPAVGPNAPACGSLVGNPCFTPVL